MRVTIVIVYFAVLISACSSPKQIAGKMQLSYNPVIAHRGAFKKNNLPENSIAALKQAITLKCWGSEFDVRMTADDSLIINHDPDFHDMAIEKTSFAELSQFKLSNGEKLPTLREYILAGLENNKTTMLVREIKPSPAGKQRGEIIVSKVLALVKELHAEEKTIYISFDYNMLKKIKEPKRSAIVQYLEGDKSPLQLKADGMDGADYHFSVFKRHPEWIQQAKDNKIALNAWTVNSAADMDWLLANGFNFITTNEPELLFEKINITR